LAEALKYARKYDFNVIPLQKGKKIPAIPSWKDYQIKKFDKEEYLKNAERYNWAYICGAVSKNLLVIDFDDEELCKELIDFDEEVKKTFVVKTSKGYHFYYKTEIPHNIEVIEFYEPGEDKPITVIHLKGEGGYVVAPGSIHPTGKIYGVLNDVEPRLISDEEIKQLKKRAEEVARKREWGLSKTPDVEIEEDEKKNELRRKLPKLTALIDLSEMNKRGSEYYGPHPIHGSTTGRNFYVNEEKQVWHCFRHGTGGDVLYWLAVKFGILDCSECKKGTLRNKKFKELLKKIKENLGIDLKTKTKTMLMKKFNPRPFTLEILEEYDNAIIYDDSETLWGYNEEKGIWEDVELKIRKELRTRILGEDKLKNYYVNEILHDIKDYCYDERPPEPHWRYINLKNGVFDIFNGELLPHDSKFFFLNRIPHALDENIKECPTIDKLFESWIGKEKKYVLYELCAYCLIRSYPYQKFFFVYGSGRNGKSKFAELLKRFVGSDFVSGRSLRDLTGDNRFAAADLFGKLVNIGGEVNVEDLKNTDMLKRLRGGDIIQAEKKHKNPFSFVNYAKLIFLMNEIPRTPDKSIAFYRSVYFIEFPYRFEGENDDTQVIEKLPEEEFQGLLYQCLYKYLPRMIDRGFKFEDDLDIETLKTLYEDLSNPVKKFIKENFDFDAEARIPKKVFATLFNSWQEERGKSTLSLEKIGRIMKGMGYEDERCTYEPDELKEFYALCGWNTENITEKRQVRSWIGLKLKKSSNFSYIQGIQDIHIPLTISKTHNIFLKKIEKHGYPGYHGYSGLENFQSNTEKSETAFDKKINFLKTLFEGNEIELQEKLKFIVEAMGYYKTYDRKTKKQIRDEDYYELKREWLKKLKPTELIKLEEYLEVKEQAQWVYLSQEKWSKLAEFAGGEQ